METEENKFHLPNSTTESQQISINFQHLFHTLHHRLASDEKEPRVHINQVAHRFHTFLQISQHVVFLHSRYERSRTSYSFVVPCSNKTCSLMLRRSGLLWTRPWCRLRCHHLCLGPIIFVVLLLGCAFCNPSSTLSGCLRSSGLVRDSRSASGLLCGRRRRRAMAFGSEQIPSMLESVVVLFL